MLTVKIEGIGELSRELESFGSSIGQCLRVGIIAGGSVIASQAAENIKPYKTDATGTLAGATDMPPRITEQSKMSCTGEIGPEGIPYGRIQELGGMTGRGHKTRIEGKHYLTRALAEKQDECIDEIVSVIRKEVNR